MKRRDAFSCSAITMGIAILMIVMMIMFIIIMLPRIDHLQPRPACACLKQTRSTIPPAFLINTHTHHTHIDIKTTQKQNNFQNTNNARAKTSSISAADLFCSSHLKHTQNHTHACSLTYPCRQSCHATCLGLSRTLARATRRCSCTTSVKCIEPKQVLKKRKKHLSRMSSALRVGMVDR